MITNYKMWYDRGRMDCAQDRCENVPFASIGGLESRLYPELPVYVNLAQLSEQCAYTEGYFTQAFEMYGKDWQICQFGWKPALTIEGNDQ